CRALAPCPSSVRQTQLPSGDCLGHRHRHIIGRTSDDSLDRLLDCDRLVRFEPELGGAYADAWAETCSRESRLLFAPNCSNIRYSAIIFVSDAGCRRLSALVSCSTWSDSHSLTKCYNAPRIRS